MTVRNHADFLAGLLFLGTGLAFFVMGRSYDFGTPLRMGPGFFPTVLAIALMMIGVVTAFRALLQPGDPIGGIALRGLALITLSAVLFGLLIQRAGILAAVVVITIVSASASVKFSWSRSMAMAVVLAAFSALVFVYALGLPIPIIGTLLGGKD